MTMCWFALLHNKDVGEAEVTWLHRFIALRKEHTVFGLGTYEPLRAENPRIFAHIRRWEDDIVLCVHNLARSAQAVELDLSPFTGMIPEEMFAAVAQLLAYVYKIAGARRAAA